MNTVAKNLRLAGLMLALSLIAMSGRAQAAPFDQTFIDAMVPHHQSGVMMAKMAVQKAQLAEVRALARRIISAQQKEIAQLKSWRKAWYGSATTPMPMMQDNGKTMRHEHMMMHGRMMGMPMKMKMDMDKLNSTQGRNFDRMFLEMMIPHHAGAIMMAHEALNVTGRKEIRAMSHKIIASQAREIGQMQGILDRRF